MFRWSVSAFKWRGRFRLNIDGVQDAAYYYSRSFLHSASALLGVIGFADLQLSISPSEV